MNGPQFIRRLAAEGRSQFTFLDASRALGGSPTAVRAVIRRLKMQGLIAMPLRGFYVIVPPEYTALRCLPADQFVPSLMNFLGVPYYVGLLSAAERHGAAHQRPQEFQVVTDHARADIVCGGVRVGFVSRRNVSEMPTVTMNTPRGFLRVATPEVTAIDLVTYPRRVGGLDLIATVLVELAERIDPDALAEIASRGADIAVVQRLGYLLDRVGASDRTDALAALVAHRARRPVRLVTNLPADGTPLDRRWRLRVNADIEVDL